MSTDGSKAWRQRGFEGWQIIATILNVDPGTREYKSCRSGEEQGCSLKLGPERRLQGVRDFLLAELGGQGLLPCSEVPLGTCDPPCVI